MDLILGCIIFWAHYLANLDAPRNAATLAIIASIKNVLNMIIL